MNKKTKFLVTIVMMAALLLMSLSVEASNKVQSEQPGIGVASINTDLTRASLSISSGKATCSAKISSKTSNTLKITMTLQQYTSGTWNKVQSWSGSKTGTLYSLSKTRSVVRGKYRVKAVMKSGSESITKYSSTVTY